MGTTEDGQEIIGSGCCVLISPQIIITAAHVVYDTKKIVVLVPQEEDNIVVDYSFIPKAYVEDAKANRFSMYDIVWPRIRGCMRTSDSEGLFHRNGRAKVLTYFFLGILIRIF